MSSAEIAADITERIRGGQRAPGQRLESYRELADLYGVAMATITTIVRILKERGVVVGLQGKGVFVPETDDAPSSVQID